MQVNIFKQHKNHLHNCGMITPGHRGGFTTTTSMCKYHTLYIS